MNKARTTNRDSLVLQKHKRRLDNTAFGKVFKSINKVNECINTLLGIEPNHGNMNLSGNILTDILMLACSSVIMYVKIAEVQNRTKNLIDEIFPKPKFSIKHMATYIGELREQKLLPEGKPHLNNQVNIIS